MSQPHSPKSKLRTWLLLGVAFMFALQLESCLCCMGELNRKIGEESRRSDPREKAHASASNFSPHAAQYGANASK